MNRAQRRKLLKSGFARSVPEPGAPEPGYRIPCRPQRSEQPDFSSVPLTTICQSITLLIDELRDRGYPVYDFDHKEKSVQGMQMIRDRIFFLMAEEAADEKAEKSDSEN